STSRGALRVGDTLRSEQSIFSSDGQVRLHMSRDCNLVLETRRQILWESRTSGQGRNCSLSIGRDGLVAIHDGGRRVWSSNARAYGDVGLVVQDDENLVAYEGRRAYWSTDTWRRGR
ncbi:MAG TPA: hypothetical protein VGB49_03390, partial [Caulobacteraceae bacterium]